MTLQSTPVVAVTTSPSSTPVTGGAFHVDAPYKLFLFSAISACTAELCTTPIDCVKTRLQLECQSKKYPSLYSTFRSILSTGGFRALYAGAGPAVARQASYGSLRVGLYSPIKRKLCGDDSATPSFALKALAGSLSGATASICCTPLDVIKIRLQSGVTVERNVARALVDLFKAEGIAGAWRSWAPTATRAAVVAAAELGAYDEFFSAAVKLGAHPASPIMHVAVSIAAGGCASLLASPADVIKTRVQNAPNGKAFAALRATLATEGIFALWRGVGADFARRAPHCVISFSIIEQLRGRFST
jgi:hypothetical protein